MKSSLTSPVHAGGEDAGLAPYDFLLAALGACTSMIAAHVRERKRPPAQRSVQRRFAPQTSCRADHIERMITLDMGDLTPEQRQRMLEIANKCPVYRTLTSEIIQPRVR